jgi:cyclic beta-1,2-glucan synthetase
LGLASIFSALVGGAVYRWMPSNLALASPWLVLWFLSPLLGWLLNLRPRAEQKQTSLAQEDLRFLRKISRHTWRYFSDFVNDGTSWLPPDNYQVSYQNQLAMRTSPTNIGLGMLATLTANDFGYLTLDQVVERLTRTIDTIGQLERHEGHLLNWYDIQTLAPLEPRYVSAVDSGNLLGALWTLEHGLEELIQTPVLDAKAFAGLRDTGEILKEAIEKIGISGLDGHALDRLLLGWEDPPERIADALGLLRRVDGNVQALADKARASAGVEAGAAYWARQMQNQLSAWLMIADRYLTWIEILEEKTEGELAQLGLDELLVLRQTLHQAPSLVEIAQGQAGGIPFLESVRAGAPSEADPLYEWFDRLVEAFARSQWLAGEMLALAERLIQDGRHVSESINMRFLYDAERRLFAIGRLL